jgi:hypothetical protein
MPKLKVLSVFTNIRVLNIDTRIENYSDPSIFTDAKIRDTIYFLHVIFINTGIEVFVVEYSLALESGIL